MDLVIRCLGNANNPMLVFLHGFMGAPSDWDAVVEPLSPTYYCCVVQLPGHGSHPTPVLPFDRFFNALDRWIVESGQIPELVVGYSLGARLAAFGSVRSKRLGKKIMMISGHPGLETRQGRKNRWATDCQLAQEIIDDFPGFLDRWYQNPIWGDLVCHPKFTELISRRLNNHPHLIANALMTYSLAKQPDLHPYLGNFNLVNWMAGEKDLRYQKLGQKLSSNLNVQFIQDVGHNVVFENPGVVSDKIQTVLAS